MTDKFLNFDGMPSDVPNDMPWSDTQWSNQAGQLTEQEAINVSTIYGTALNASGQESITLDHHDSRIGPDVVLELPDSDKMGKTPDSDQWSNHPGFLGITWSKSKAESERYQKELNKVNGQYPNTGSCAVLTDSLDRIDSSLASLNANKDAGGKGAKRVNARARKARNARRGSIASGAAAACAGEEAAWQRQQVELPQLMLQAAPQARQGGMSATNLILGVLVLGGIGFGLYKMVKR